MHVVKEDVDRLGKGSAAELLGAWRGAERDLAAAVDSASVATLTALAANEASLAATETADAARVSARAAGRAEHSATRAADAARIASSSAKVEKTSADDAVEQSQTALTDAHDRFNRAQDRGFPKG